VAPGLIPAPIRRFAAAVESGDVAQIKQAYPGLTASQEKNWENFFKQSKDIRARIQSVRGVSSNDATGTAVVEFVMALSSSDRASGTAVASRPSRYQARLRREGSALVLLSLTDVTARR
jgi:hypothetical protein